MCHSYQYLSHMFFVLVWWIYPLGYLFSERTQSVPLVTHGYVYFLRGSGNELPDWPISCQSTCGRAFEWWAEGPGFDAPCGRIDFHKNILMLIITTWLANQLSINLSIRSCQPFPCGVPVQWQSVRVMSWRSRVRCPVWPNWLSQKYFDAYNNWPVINHLQVKAAAFHSCIGQLQDTWLSYYKMWMKIYSFLLQHGFWW